MKATWPGRDVDETVGDTRNLRYSKDAATASDRRQAGGDSLREVFVRGRIVLAVGLFCCC